MSVQLVSTHKLVSTHNKQRSIIRRATTRIHSSSFVQLLKAARGVVDTNADANVDTNADASIDTNVDESNPISSSKIKRPNPLPCFPLHPDHIRILPSNSNNGNNNINGNPFPTVSSTPTEFHSHLCNSIRNAKRRVKLAALYIGAGNGCMSMMSNNSMNSQPPSREEQLLQELRDLSIRQQNQQHQQQSNHQDIQIKIIMDESRATRPIKIVPTKHQMQTPNNNNSINETETTTTATNSTTTSVNEVYHALFPNGSNIHSSSSNTRNNNNTNDQKKGVALLKVHRGIKAMLPSPLNEVMGVFHLKVCFLCVYLSSFIAFFSQ